MDFVADQLSYRHRIRTLTIIDLYTREGLGPHSHPSTATVVSGALTVRSPISRARNRHSSRCGCMRKYGGAKAEVAF